MDPAGIVAAASQSGSGAGRRCAPGSAAISSRSCGKNAGLTQAQVAALMGVTQAQVSQIEHGKITEVDAMRRCPGRTEGLSGRTLCPRTLLTGIGTSRVVALDHVLPWVLMTWK